MSIDDDDTDQVSAASVTLAQAAEALGVHYMTAYRYVRTGRMPATKHGGVWRVTQEALASAKARVPGQSEGRQPRARPASLDRAAVRAFTDRLLVGDTGGCWRTITDQLAGGAKPIEVHQRLIEPALTRVGEQWAAGKISVADEHRATAVMTRLLGQMGPLFRHAGRRRGAVVLGASAGDSHALPTALLADALSDRHFEVIDLGANMPPAGFVEVAEHADDLVAVGVCCVVAEAVGAAIETVMLLRRSLPDTLLFAGGAGVIDASERFETLVDMVTASSTEVGDAIEARWHQLSGTS